MILDDPTLVNYFIALLSQYGLVGICALIVVQALTTFIKACGLPTQLAPLAVLAIAITMGEGLAYYNHLDYVQGAVIGVMLAAVSGFSYDANKFKTVLIQWFAKSETAPTTEDDV